VRCTSNYDSVYFDETTYPLSIVQFLYLNRLIFFTKTLNSMRKFTPYSWLLAFCLLSLSPLYSQTANFATWKDNKKAAYTIVHDDFGDWVTGIYDHAYPIATARGIKFSFGAITGNCGATEWTKARTMMTGGHECINHSHSHKCGGPASDCTGSLTYGPADFAVELDQSTQLIQTNTGVRPIFFIHPYDAYTTTVLDYLKNNLGYIGSRAGTGSLNSSNFTNFMNINFYGFDNSASAISSLKASVDDVILAGGYLMREFHGINDPSYGAITIANYTTHLDYVKSKMDAGLLWSATASEVITYKMQRDAYTIATVFDAPTGTINVNFTNTKTINTAILKTPVTVNVDVASIAGTFTVSQGIATIASTRSGNIISFNVYPYQGNVVLKTGTVNPTQPNNISNFLATPQSSSVALSWTNPLANFDEVMIVAKATTAFTSQPSGTNYVADANFAGAGTAFEGGKVVSRGKNSTITVTGLTNGTLYHFKAFSRFGALWSNGVAISAAPVAPSTGGFDPALCYRLTARHSGKVMGLASTSVNNNITLVQNPWVGIRDQIWRIKQIDATYYQLTSGLSGKAVSVQNSSTANLAAIIQTTYSALTSQQWKFNLNTEGYYSLIARHSSRAIDVTGDNVADNTPLVQWRDNGGTNQQWKIEAVGCPTGTLALAANRIVSFGGHLEDKKGVLQWVIHSEYLKDYYEIEKMDETQNFKSLTTINGNSADALRSFSFTDDSLEDGENIYRLKSVDNDGSVQVSDIVTIKYQQPDIYTLSPNPTTNYVDVNLAMSENRPVILTVIDASGHKMQVISIEKASKTHRIELNDLATGQYFLHIRTAGKRDITRMFIISK
jgi:Ricin-type beta-trefoil lectin domain-like/Polysaccharide deacetylase/Secretion system C-terminal sorting domain